MDAVAAVLIFAIICAAIIHFTKLVTAAIHRSQIARQDHEANMRMLANDHAVKVAEFKQQHATEQQHATDLQARSVHIEIHASSADFIRLNLAKIDKRSIR